jgi:hypothetical protein
MTVHRELSGSDVLSDIEPALTLLTGAVLVRAAFEGRRVTDAFINDLTDRVPAPLGRDV